MLFVGFVNPFSVKSWMPAVAYISASFPPPPQVQQDPREFMQLSELSICSSSWAPVSSCCSVAPL